MSQLIEEPKPKQPEPALTNHTYDGIQEYDNPTPGWWTWTFILTILWSAVYFFVATMSGGQLSPQAFYERYKFEEMKSAGVLSADAASLLQLSRDEESLKAGAAIFAANCIACHARDGSGLTGSNLTDEKFVHVATITDLVDVVRHGRNNGAMPAWGNRLDANDVIRVSAYAASLRGQNKPGKAVEPGAKEIAPWSE